MLDRAVLAGGVERLEDQQHRPAILGVQPLLQVGHALDALLEQLVALVLQSLEAARVVRMRSRASRKPRTGNHAVVHRERIERRARHAGYVTSSAGRSKMMLAHTSAPIITSVPVMSAARPRRWSRCSHPIAVSEIFPIVAFHLGAGASAEQHQL